MPPMMPPPWPSPPRGGRCGGSPLGEAPAAPSGGRAQEEARGYVKWCADHPTFQPEKVREVVMRGNSLLRLAGSIERAA
eukprot:1387168-Pyramimonas_sp.AAC.1